MASTLPRLAIFEAITRHDPQLTAVVHSLSGRSFTYDSLIQDVAEATKTLKSNADGRTLEGQRIAFLIENGYDYVGADVEPHLPRGH
jgi:malonyl-CoA/methylmalonyl-CoA synthetase